MNLDVYRHDELPLPLIALSSSWYYFYLDAGEVSFSESVV